MAAFFIGAALHLCVMPLDFPSTVDLAGREGLPPTVRLSIDPPSPCGHWKVCIRLFRRAELSHFHMTPDTSLRFIDFQSIQSSVL